MKNRKWLLIIVSIVMLVNIAFFFLIRLSVVEDIVEDRVSKYISENLNAEVHFGNFTFNDKQLRIIDLRVSSQDMFRLEINQIYIEYNLAQLLLSNFKHLHAIKHIKIYDPTLHYYFKPSQKEKSGTGLIPDIASYFKKLDIHNGTISLHYESEELKAEKILQELNLSIINRNDTQLTLNCKGTKSDSIYAQAILEDGKLLKVIAELSDFDISSIELEQLDDFVADLDFSIAYENAKLEYNGVLKNIKVHAFERKATAQSLEFSGNEVKLSGQFVNLNVDGNKIKLHVEMENVLSNQRMLTASLSTSQILLQKYVPEVQGFVDLEVGIAGSIKDMIITMEASADSLYAQKQKFSDVQLTGKMRSEVINFSLENAIWEENTITGSGTYPLGQDLSIDLQSTALKWQDGVNSISGDLIGNLVYDDQLNLILELQNFKYSNPDFELTGMRLSASLFDNDFSAYLHRDKNDLQITCRGLLEPQTIEAQIKFKRFDLREFLNKSSLPIISGNLDISANEFSIVLNSVLRAYDQDFGKLNGRLSTNFVADLANDRTVLNMRTYSSKFNYEPFSLNLFAEGTLDSISTKQFVINQDLNINAWCELKPELQFGVNLAGEKIKVKDIAKYFMSYYNYSELQGSADIQMYYDSRQNGLINGNVSFEKIKIGSMKEFNGQLTLDGSNDRISLSNSYVNCCDDRILNLSGEMSLKPEFSMAASGALERTSLQNVFLDSKLQGDVSGSFNFESDPQSQILNAEISGENLINNDLKIDEARLRFTQEDSLLTIHELIFNNEDLFSLEGGGSIGYNFLNSTIFPDSHTVYVSFQGDLLEFLANQSSSLQSGESNCKFDLKFGMVETGVFVDEGNFELKKGQLNIKDQPSEIDNINLIFNIENDRLNISKFNMKTGEGKLYIKNEITDSEEDFLLGSLNLGKFKVRSNIEGMMVYIPGYTPRNSFIHGAIMGRNSDYLEVIGPFDDLKIIGDMLVFNGDLIYPPNTDNLMNLFNISKPEKKENSELNPLPISFDVLLHVGENIRYVTFPIDVKVTEDGYLHLKYANDEMQKPDAFFYAEEGSVDMFGTTLILDFMQIQLNQFGTGVNISGIFYKKASDGTLITLEIFNDNNGDGSFGNLKFELNSDDPTDMIIDILAKLRYNRTMDEISPAQKKTLLQDEVIQIAGLGLESAVLDPLISPVENTLRQLFRLDYFHLQTDLIQNLFASYSSESKSEYTITEEQSQVDQFTSEMFLNNLSVSAGKYLTRKLFFDYELRLEREDQIVTDTYLGVYQDFKIRYDLPWKFKASYQYFILPFDEINQHQIGIERSLKF
jgi:hypothetical protein